MAGYKIPKDVLENMFLLSSRDFKSLKRQQLRGVAKALSEFDRGCAHIPKEAYDEYTQAKKLLTSVQSRLSVKKWGR